MSSPLDNLGAPPWMLRPVPDPQAQCVKVGHMYSGGHCLYCDQEEPDGTE